MKKVVQENHRGACRIPPCGRFAAAFCAIRFAFLTMYGKALFIWVGDPSEIYVRSFAGCMYVLIININERMA